MSYAKNGLKTLLAGSALAVCLGITFNAQAQTCTTDNWTGTGAGSPTVGKQDGDNRRYGGPCGMRVQLNGSPHYVSDPSPAGETAYIARFYVYLENPGSNPINLFAADDGTNDRVQVIYQDGSIILSVWDVTASAWVDVPAGGVSVGSGWHSIELAWEQGASATVALNVDGAGDETDTVDTSGITLENAHLGNLNSNNSGGLVDFDDFDSRRQTRPGLLLRGDVDASGGHDAADNTTLLLERLGIQFAAGQPDCDENGTIDAADNTCLLLIRLGIESP